MFKMISMSNFQRKHFTQLRKQAAIKLYLFASTYLDKQGFSKMTMLKTKPRSRLPKENLQHI